MDRRAWDRGARVVAVLGLLLLSAFVQLTVVRDTRINKPIRADAEKYVSYAYNLDHSGVFSHANTWQSADESIAPAPDKLTLPGYPAFLTLFLQGRPDAAFIRRVTLAQAMLGIASTLLLFAIALRVLPLPWAFASAALVATSPHMATISTYLLTEALFTTLLLASVLAIVLALQPANRRWHWALAGALLGLACLVRPQLQFLPVLALLVAITVRRARAWLPRLLLACACFAAVVAPWMLRNATIDSPAGSPDLLVATLYNGSFPNMMYRDDPATYGHPYFYDPGRVDATRDLPAVLAHIGAAFSREPLRYAQWYLFGKPGFFLSWGMLDAVGGVFVYPAERSPYLDNAIFKTLRSINFAVHWPLMLLGLAGAFMALWKPRSIDPAVPRQIATAVLATIFLYAIALHMLGTPLSRYAIPFRPLVYVLALAMARATWRRLRSVRSAPAMPRVAG